MVPFQLLESNWESQDGDAFALPTKSRVNPTGNRLSQRRTPKYTERCWLMFRKSVQSWAWFVGKPEIDCLTNADEEPDYSAKQLDCFQVLGRN